MSHQLNTRDDQPLYYMASPYTHADAEVRRVRAINAAQAAAALKRAGLHVFSPIAHGHALAEHGLPAEYNGFWKPFSRNTLRRCDGLIILTLPGWKDSSGVTDETNYHTYLDNGRRPLHFISLEQVLSGAFDVSPAGVFSPHHP